MVADLVSLGFFRWVEDDGKRDVLKDNVECAFILFQQLIQKLPVEPHERRGPKVFADRCVQRCGEFDELVALHRLVKALVFRGTPVLVGKFYLGTAEQDNGSATIVEKHARMIQELDSEVELTNTSEKPYTKKSIVIGLDLVATWVDMRVTGGDVRFGEITRWPLNEIGRIKCDPELGLAVSLTLPMDKSVDKNSLSNALTTSWFWSSL